MLLHQKNYAEGWRLIWQSQFWFWMGGKQDKVFTRIVIVFVGYVAVSVNVTYDKTVASVQPF